MKWLAALIFVFSCQDLTAQDSTYGVVWGPPIQLAPTPINPCYNYTVHLASAGGILHAAWASVGRTILGKFRLPYTRSTTDGRTWEAVRSLLTDTVRFEFQPPWEALMATPEYLSIVFTCSRSGISTLFNISSSNEGDSWSDVNVVDSTDSTGIIDTGAARGDSMAVQYPSATLHARWLVRSSDRGQTWSRSPRSMPSWWSQDGALLFTPGYLMVAHPGDTWPGPGPEVVVHRSTDLGTTWRDSVALSPVDGNSSDMAQIASYTYADGRTTVACVWRDNGFGGGTFLGGAAPLSISTNNGDSWSLPQLLTEVHNAYRPAIAILENTIAVAWVADSSLREQIKVRWSFDLGQTWSPVYPLTNDTGNAGQPSIVLTPTAIHVAWDNAKDTVVNVFYRRGEIVQSGVENSNQPLPIARILLSNYPNPFNSTTTIRYEIGERGRVSIAVFDILGREVKRLVSDVQSVGIHSVTWDANDTPSGVYFCRLTAGRVVKTQKMLLLR
jgi:hypothetical protein